MGNSWGPRPVQARRILVRVKASSGRGLSGRRGRTALGGHWRERGKEKDNRLPTAAPAMNVKLTTLPAGIHQRAGLTQRRVRGRWGERGWAGRARGRGVLGGGASADGRGELGGGASAGAG